MASNCTISRDYMIKNLKRNYLPGLTKEEIVELLGPSFSNPTPTRSKYVFAYCLKPVFGGFDNKFLLVLIDEDGYYMDTEYDYF